MSKSTPKLKAVKFVGYVDVPILGKLQSISTTQSQVAVSLTGHGVRLQPPNSKTYAVVPLSFISSLVFEDEES